MPLSRGRQGPAAALSLGVHLVIAALVLGGGAVLFKNTAVASPTPSHSRQRVVSWVALPLAAEPQTKARRTPTLPEGIRVPIVAPSATNPLRIENPRLTLAAVAPAMVPTVEVDARPDSNIAKDTAVVAAPPSDLAAGLDRGAGDIFGPTPLLTPNAPPGAPLGDKRTREVRFSIRADGLVTRIEIIPPIRDSRYHRVFLKAMKDFAFSPAKTRDGRPIDYVYSIVVHP